MGYNSFSEISPQLLWGAFIFFLGLILPSGGTGQLVVLCSEAQTVGSIIVDYSGPGDIVRWLW